MQAMTLRLLGFDVLNWWFFRQKEVPHRNLPFLLTECQSEHVWSQKAIRRETGLFSHADFAPFRFFMIFREKLNYSAREFCYSHHSESGATFDARCVPFERHRILNVFKTSYVHQKRKNRIKILVTARSLRSRWFHFVFLSFFAWLSLSFRNLLFHSFVRSFVRSWVSSCRPEFIFLSY
jgi:hypothetical protein